MKIAFIDKPGGNFPEIHKVPEVWDKLSEFAKKMLLDKPRSSFKDKYAYNWLTPFMVLQSLKNPVAEITNVDVLYYPPDEQIYLMRPQRNFKNKKEYLVEIFQAFFS